MSIFGRIKIHVRLLEIINKMEGFALPYNFSRLKLLIANYMQNYARRSVMKVLAYHLFSSFPLKSSALLRCMDNRLEDIIARVMGVKIRLVNVL